jgi:hypothetical protein
MRDPVVPDSDTDLPLLPRRACLKGLALGLAAQPTDPLRGQRAAVRRDLRAPRRLRHEHAAVDVQGLPGDVACLRGH